MPDLWTPIRKDDDDNSVHNCLYKIGLQAYNILIPTYEAVRQSRDSENDVLCNVDISPKPFVVGNSLQFNGDTRKVTYKPADRTGTRNESIVVLLPDEPNKGASYKKQLVSWIPS